MKIEIDADRQKAEALRKMAKITIERLDQTSKEKYPSNTLIDYYDAIHKLMEAISIMEGIKIKGEGAHMQLIDYIAEKQHITAQDRLFLQEMREYRNRISYEGFMINANYIELNKDIIGGIMKRLLAPL
jgi:copper homeostasis protein CutC